MFEFTAVDYFKPVKHVFENLVTFEDFGITKEQYTSCEQIDFNYTENWDRTISDDLVIPYGFANVDDFKTCYVRSHIYNWVIIGEDGKSLFDELKFYYTKAKRFYPNDGVPEIPESGNLYDYLMEYDIEMLFAIGW